VSFQEFIGKKLGMTQIFNQQGNAVPVTVIQLVPMTVTQVKTPERDGYSAVQIGYEPAKEKHLTKGQMGHLKKNDVALFRRLKEVKYLGTPTVQVGDVVSTEALVEDISIDVVGRSIGKGFQGNTKRWHHGRGPMSHGSKSHRLPGSIGAGTTPGRVFKGLQMAGHMGDDKVTVKNLKIARVIADQQLVLVQGAVPGVEGGYVTLKLRQAQWNSIAG
jgi:large subunit ribosomal protein L3